MASDTITTAAVRADLRDLNRLYTSLRKVDREGADEFGRALGDAGEAVAVVARGLAHGRVKDQIKVRRSRTKVLIVAGPGSKPHAGEAAAFEHRGVPGEFRHPVFGHKDRKWAKSTARPALVPAVNLRADATADRIAEAATRAFVRAGF